MNKRGREGECTHRGMHPVYPAHPPSKKHALRVVCRGTNGARRNPYSMSAPCSWLSLCTPVYLGPLIHTMLDILDMIREHPSVDTFGYNTDSIAAGVVMCKAILAQVGVVGTDNVRIAVLGLERLRLLFFLESLSVYHSGSSHDLELYARQVRVLALVPLLPTVDRKRDMTLRSPLLSATVCMLRYDFEGDTQGHSPVHVANHWMPASGWGLAEVAIRAMLRMREAHACGSCFLECDPFTVAADVPGNCAHLMHSYQHAYENAKRVIESPVLAMFTLYPEGATTATVGTPGDEDPEDDTSGNPGGYLGDLLGLEGETFCDFLDPDIPYDAREADNDDINGFL